MVLCLMTMMVVMGLMFDVLLVVSGCAAVEGSSLAQPLLFGMKRLSRDLVFL
jgi:hypothetical protein